MFTLLTGKKGLIWSHATCEVPELGPQMERGAFQLSTGDFAAQHINIGFRWDRAMAKVTVCAWNLRGCGSYAKPFLHSAHVHIIGGFCGLPTNCKAHSKLQEEKAILSTPMMYNVICPGLIPLQHYTGFTFRRWIKVRHWLGWWVRKCCHFSFIATRSTRASGPQQHWPCYDGQINSLRKRPDWLTFCFDDPLSTGTKVL